jgi:cyanate lyase
MNTETVKMAKKLGLDHKNLIKNIPNKSQSWKKPVYLWIRDMYQERFGDSIMSSIKNNKDNSF